MIDESAGNGLLPHNIVRIAGNEYFCSFYFRGFIKYILKYLPGKNNNMEK